jgi:hypothetical protein
MGEGLIGLIILIVVINVLGRILKAVTSAARSGTQQAKPQQAAPRPTREQQILAELLELEHERAGEAFEKGETVEAAEVPESKLPEQAAGFEGGEKSGGFARWAEERFEKAAPADTYGEREPAKAAPAIDQAAAASADRTAWARTPAPARKGAVSPIAAQNMLGDVSSLRTAVLLSVILGPCRARNRSRSRDRIV